MGRRTKIPALQASSAHTAEYLVSDLIPTLNAEVPPLFFPLNSATRFLIGSARRNRLTNAHPETGGTVMW